MTTRRQFVAHAGLALAAAALPGTLRAQAWPTRPIKVVVPLPPGGGSDYLARLLADPVQQALGQPFVVENRVGADSRIGLEYAARQPADGHTIAMIVNTQVIQPSLLSKIPYDILTDFEPVSLIANINFVLVVHSSVAARSMKEYVEIARDKPGKVTFGSSGIGTPFHLAGELLKSMTGVDMLHVPYRGSAPVMTALLAGELMSAFAPLHAGFLPYIQSGKLRPLGILNSRRSSLLPELPTIAEASSLPGLAIDSWLGAVMPAGTAKPIVERVSRTIGTIVREPAFARQHLLPKGYEPIGSTPAEMAAVMKSDVGRYAKIVKDARIPVE